MKLASLVRRKWLRYLTVEECQALLDPESGSRAASHKYLKGMVGDIGLEPMTPCL